MTLIISRDQKLAALDGKSYTFKAGNEGCDCCAGPIRGICDGPRNGLCEPCFRKDRLRGVWKPEKELYDANRLV